MAKAGYKPLSTMNSPEDEYLRRFERHLDPFGKNGDFPVEPHLTIVRQNVDHAAVLKEVWQSREETNANGIRIGHLSKNHFILHTLHHCSKDLSDMGFIAIKGLMDILFALETPNIDWS